MHTPIELPSRTIFYRSDLHLMVVRWHSHASLDVIQVDYAQMLAAMRRVMGYLKEYN